MKPKMYSAKTHSMLHDHILDGTFSTHEGLVNAKKEKVITQDEYVQLLERTIQRLKDRVYEFRIREGIIEGSRRMTSILFAIFFTWLQITSSNGDMRRSSRSRARNGRTQNQRAGRRSMDEQEEMID